MTQSTEKVTFPLPTSPHVIQNKNKASFKNKRKKNLTKFHFSTLMFPFILVLLLCFALRTCLTSCWLTWHCLCSQIGVLLDLVYSAWKASMNEFALITQVQRVIGHNFSHQMNGFDKLGPAQSGFPSIFFVLAQMHQTNKFQCLSSETYTSSSAGGDSGFFEAVPFFGG